MRSIIIDFRASHKTVDALLNMNFNVIKTIKMKNVYNTICGHADIMLHKFPENTIITEPHCTQYFQNYLPYTTVLAGEYEIKSEYPYDIAYNSACVGNSVFCYEKYTEPKILEYYYKNGFKIINTKQGYAKCSICVISNNAIITSDKNIFSLADKNNIDVLMVDDSEILLDDFEHGFIGGATGLLDKNTLAVNGNIELHKDCMRIIDFCEKYNVSVKSLHKDKISDIGSLISI